jgi:hypothetical protein
MTDGEDYGHAVWGVDCRIVTTATTPMGHHGVLAHGHHDRHRNNTFYGDATFWRDFEEFHMDR